MRFEVQAAEVDEAVRPGELPEHYVSRLALDKAVAVSSVRPDRLVLGADTSVVVDKTILGKPADEREAGEMLGQLTGRSHQVLTGVALAGPGGSTLALEVSTVWFEPMTSEDIQQYLATDEWRDKAGAYGIQGRASRFIARLEGSYTNVVGLPVALVCDLLMRYPEGRGAVRSKP